MLSRDIIDVQTMSALSSDDISIIFIIPTNGKSFTYDHRHQKTGHPVRSAIHKLVIGRLVVGSVTTSESLLSVVCFWLFFDWGKWAVREGWVKVGGMEEENEKGREGTLSFGFRYTRTKRVP